MFAFVCYQLISFFRSLRFIPPVAVFFVWIFLLYTYKYVSTLSSYAVSSIALYIISTWLAMVLFTIEGESEKHILFSHIGKIKFLAGKWIVCLIITLPLLLLAILYPIFGENFIEPVNGVQLALSLYSHFIFSVFGILVGTIFSATRFAIKKYSRLLAVFAVVLSLAQKGLIESFALLKWLLWIFPPIFQVIAYMGMGDDIILGFDFWIDQVFVIVYCIIALLVVWRLYSRKER